MCRYFLLNSTRWVKLFERKKERIRVKKNGLDIIQDTEIQHLDVTKQNNIYVKYSKKLFKSFRSYKFFEL